MSLTQKRLRRAALTAVASTALGLGLVSNAAASPQEPVLADFANCPLGLEPFSSDFEFPACLHAVVTGGKLVLGKQTTPIARPGDTLDFGTTSSSGPTVSTQLPLYAPKSGEAFGGPAQVVPGGALGLGLDKLVDQLGVGKVINPTRVTASIEQASPAKPGESLDPTGAKYYFSALGQLLGTSPTLAVPVKIHLHNALLGPKCYIGSDKDPIVWNLTVGTTDPPAPNEPITGDGGTLDSGPIAGTDGAASIGAIGATLVDNAFAVPAATGCGPLGLGLLDPVINAKVGLPSPAGHNTAIIKSDSELAVGLG